MTKASTKHLVFEDSLADALRKCDNTLKGFGLRETATVGVAVNRQYDTFPKNNNHAICQLLLLLLVPDIVDCFFPFFFAYPM